MKFIVFDTETTGLPKEPSKHAFKEPNNWPHLVSISWAVMNEKFDKILSSQSYIIKPNGWEIPEESTAIHGITNEDALDYGHDLLEVMNKFLEEDGQAYIAHNIHFDKNVIYNAIRWDLKNEDFKGFGVPKLCTLRLGQKLCKLPKNKIPKLFELYTWSTKKEVDTTKLHNSMYDTQILCDCITSSDEIRKGLVESYLKETNENKEISTPKLQETPAETVGYQGDINFVV